MVVARGRVGPASEAASVGGGEGVEGGTQKRFQLEFVERGGLKVYGQQQQGTDAMAAPL